MNQQQITNLSRRKLIGLFGATAAASLAGGSITHSASEEPANKSAGKPNGRLVQIDAKADAIEIDISKTAVIVIDMQNDFASPGGMLDRVGIPIAMIQQVVPPIARVLTAARKADIPIIYTQNGIPPDLSDLGKTRLFELKDSSQDPRWDDSYGTSTWAKR